jgi:hypothetical protein
MEDSFAAFDTQARVISRVDNQCATVRRRTRRVCMRTKLLLALAGVWTLGAASACGSTGGADSAHPALETTETGAGGQSSTSAGTSEGEPGSLPVSVTGICNNLLAAHDIAFGTAVFAISDACPSQRRGAAPLESTTVADVKREAPGKYCVSGLLSTGFAILIVSVDHINDRPPPQFHGPLDAPAHGITQVRFTLESPPSTGLQVSASNVVRDECPFSSDDCIQSGFYILSEAGTPVNVTEPGTYTHPLSNYRPGPGTPPTLALDTTRLAGFEFQLNPGTFDFCVSDVALLDNANAPVSPPQ